VGGRPARRPHPAPGGGLAAFAHSGRGQREGGDMSLPASFLTSLAHLLSTMRLYARKHPSREQAIDEAFEQLNALLAEHPRPVFSFLDGEVIFGERPLYSMRDWLWSPRLAALGIERLELQVGVAREEIESFVEDVFARWRARPDAGEKTPLPVPAADGRPSGHPHIRVGGVAVRGMEQRTPIPTATLRLDLLEEARAMSYVHERVAESDEVPLSEAEAVIRLLAVAMHSGEDLLLPLVELKEVDQYATTHSLNVAVLSMALAEVAGLPSTDIRAVGAAAMMHDVGKARLPAEILTKPGALTEEEWAVIRTHTTEGARILLAAGGDDMELAAVVAYEHHMHWKGGGYPEVRFPRRPHRITQLVQVCDVYDALRTRRVYRPPWPAPRAVAYIREQAGQMFDPEFVTVFLTMIQQWEPQIVPMTLGEVGADAADDAADEVDDTADEAGEESTDAADTVAEEAAASEPGSTAEG